MLISFVMLGVFVSRQVIKQKKSNNFRIFLVYGFFFSGILSGIIMMVTDKLNLKNGGFYMLITFTITAIFLLCVFINDYLWIYIEHIFKNKNRSLIDNVLVEIENKVKDVSFFKIIYYFIFAIVVIVIMFISVKSGMLFENDIFGLSEEQNLIIGCIYFIIVLILDVIFLIILCIGLHYKLNQRKARMKLEKDDI